MNFQNMNLYIQVAQEALKNYGVEDTHQIELLHRSENITYLVFNKSTKEKLGVLRIGRPDYRTWEELNAEISWLKQIKDDTNVVTAKPMKNLEGQEVTQIWFNGKNHFCILFDYLAGENPDPLDKNSAREFEQVGEIAARLHQHTRMWKGGKQLQRPVWDYDALLGEDALFGDWRLCKELGAKEHALLHRTCVVILKRLKRYGINEWNFGLIHSDLRAANLLVDGTQMKVIDFDDCGYGWYLYDLAASISFLEDHSMVSEWIEGWIRGYEKVLAFEAKDYDEINTFIMVRRIQLLAWITSHDDSDPVKLFYEGYADRTVEMAQRYLKKYKR